jgi:membrane protein implicated in regulation of membrane protease activity
MEFSTILSNAATVWFIIGLILLLAEFLLPGLIIIFFGIGAWFTSLATGLFEISINFQIIIFLVSSVVLLVVLRKYLKNKFFREKSGQDVSLEDEFINKTAEAETDFKSGHGKIMFKGTLWNAISNEEIKKGDYVKIVSKDSITLNVKSLKS